MENIRFTITKTTGESITISMDGEKNVSEACNYLCDEGFLSFYDDNFCYTVNPGRHFISILPEDTKIKDLKGRAVYVHVIPKSDIHMPRVELYGCPNASIEDIEKLRKQRKVTVRRI